MSRHGGRRHGHGGGGGGRRHGGGGNRHHHRPHHRPHIRPQHRPHHRPHVHIPARRHHGHHHNHRPGPIIRGNRWGGRRFRHRFYGRRRYSVVSLMLSMIGTLIGGVIACVFIIAYAGSYWWVSLIVAGVAILILCILVISVLRTCFALQAINALDTTGDAYQNPTGIVAPQTTTVVTEQVQVQPAIMQQQQYSQPQQFNQQYTQPVVNVVTQQPPQQQQPQVGGYQTVYDPNAQSMVFAQPGTNPDASGQMGQPLYQPNVTQNVYDSGDNIGFNSVQPQNTDGFK